MSYEDSYYAAKSRYYDACSEITSCENRANELRSQRQQKITYINQLKAELRRNQDASLNLSNALKADVELRNGLSKISSNMSVASENLVNMANSSSIQNKSLESVYSAETSKTQSELNNILFTLESKKTTINNKIVELQESIRRAEAELQNIESGINAANSAASSWRTTRNNASCDMEYYRRKMQEEE